MFVIKANESTTLQDRESYVITKGSWAVPQVTRTVKTMQERNIQGFDT
jgi:hypothetical protein